jgi:GNAT superfamily N-acetyltransferase
MAIRQYTTKDLRQVRNIHFETGFMGESMSELLTRRKEWNDKINYYLEKEPESIFVAEEDGKVEGYILGCLDDSKYDQKKEFILSTLSLLFRMPFLPKHDRRYWISNIKAIFRAITGKSEEKNLKTPENSGHIHINLLAKSRRKGLGSDLLKAYIKYAKEKGAKSIHAETYEADIHNNASFWLKNGFKEYSKVKTTMWQTQYPGKEMFIVCYAKEL